MAMSSAQYYAGLPYPYAAAPLAAPAYAAAPYAAPLTYAAPAPVNYALPPPREIQEAPLVAQTVEKVEQHGYSIRY